MKYIENFRSQCSGCMACVQLCPHKAIMSIRDEHGFDYPKIDQNLCVGCNLCVLACQCNSTNNSINDDTIQAYGSMNKNQDMRLKSQSGGVFSAIAEVILAQNGICYGAAINSDLTVSQKRIDKVENLYYLQGSKYVQSDVGESFIMAGCDLKEGRIVLYSGTSCMIHGLQLFLDKSKISTENLFTADLICHGVVSPGLFEDNQMRLERKYNETLTKINFRDKQFAGWHRHVETYEFSSGKNIHEEVWAGLMYSHFAMRECCYHCNYLEIKKKTADITMADFWGVENVILNFSDDNKGYSLAIANSDQGTTLLKSANLELTQVEVKTALQRNIQHSVKKPYQYEMFWKVYSEKGFESVLRKYTSYGGLSLKIKRKILSLIKKW